MIAFRIRRPSVAITLALGLLLAGVVGADRAAAHHPQVSYEYQDESWRGAGAGSATGDDADGVNRYFLRRDDCGSGADNFHLSFEAGNPDGGDGCGFIPPGWNALNEAFGALGDEEGLVHDYPAAQGLPFTLDGTTDITGRIVIQSYRGLQENPGGLGAGISRVHLTLTGRSTDPPATDTLGQTTEEYVVTPDQGTYEVDFQMPEPTEFDGTEYGSLNLRIRLDGPAANHGFIALSGSSFIDIPGTPGDQEPREVPEERLSGEPCENGRADVFDCDGIDLLSFVPASEIESAGISDIWGWTDTDSEPEDEYVMMGKTNGTAFFRVTDPFNPVYLGALPNPGLSHQEWHDVKVYDNHAFIVSESDAHGMLVFDLTRLRGVEEAQEWDADAHYELNWAAHNIVINEDSGFAYIVGGNAGIVAPDQCLSGLHMVNISDPTNPTFAGCYALEGGPGTAARTVGGTAEEVSPAAYVHDAQCVNYDGPDPDHQGREICLMASEDKVVIADVTDKALPTTLGVTDDYEDVTYAHQGWFSDDKRYWFVNDELDEADGLVENTRTIVLDVSDLDAPRVHHEHFHETVSPDHNNYVHEGLLYQSNYSSGLRVLDTARVAEESLEEVAFFDTFPNAEDTFDGTWSNYPFFDSGTIAVSGRNEGLFLLRLQEDEDTEHPSERRGPPDHVDPEGPPEDAGPADDPGGSVDGDQAAEAPGADREQIHQAASRSVVPATSTTGVTTGAALALVASMLLLFGSTAWARRRVRGEGQRPHR